MKKEILICTLMLSVFGMVEAASASLVNFDLAGGAGGAAVTVTEFAKWGKLTGTLAPDLDSQIFSLNDGETKTVDFFTLKTAGVAWKADYQVTATLAFDLPSPMAPAVGDGGGTFSTLLGLLSGGTLSWSTQPAAFLLADGNTISISFEEGRKVGFGNKAMVHAYITNEGGGVAEISNGDGGATPTINAPVPEPATMFLFGTGLVTFAGLTLSRMKK